MKTKIDLVTGFLGAGKTTFLKGYVNYLRELGEEPVIIENEFGQAGVDASILSASEFSIHQLTGGCICCGQKVPFHDMIIELAQTYTRILVEPSGIYTLEDFFQVCKSPRIQECCEINTIFTVVDIAQLKTASHQAQEILYSQLAGAGAILISRCDTRENGEQKRLELEQWMNQLFLSQGDLESRENVPIWAKNWQDFTGEDYANLEEAGYVDQGRYLKKQDHSRLYASITVRPVFANSQELEDFIGHLWEEKYGEIIRIKGYLELSQGQVWQVNSTPFVNQITAAEGDVSELGLNLIGAKINRKAISNLMKKAD